MIVGVTEGYKKSLEINGTGYRVTAKGKDLEFALGFSHPVIVPAPAGITLHGGAADAVHRRRHRQAAGRRGRREHPEDPPAGAVQGQGRASTRARSSAARLERQVRSDATLLKRRSGGVAAKRAVGRARRHFRVRKNVTRHGRASPPGRHPVAAAHHGADRGRHQGPHARLGLDAGRLLRGAEGDKRPWPRKVGALLAERAKAAGVSRSSSTAVATGTRGGSPRSPTPPAKPDSSSRKEWTNAWSAAPGRRVRR